jgi:PAS domain S-box-containing protein
MVWRTDASGQCDYCNPAWLEYTGRSLAQESGSGWLDGVHPHDRAAWTGAFEQSLKNREPFEIQYRLRRADGQYGWIICSCRPYYDMQGELAGYLASCYDNTIRRRMEAEIESSRERILAFSRHLQTAREEEKARVARELHDELGATLTALRLEISALLKRVPAQDDAGAGNDSRGAIRLADSAIQSIRKIITDLRPSILDNLGLLAALRWQANDFSKRTGIRVEVSGDDREITVDKAHALAFFRIAQEALTNALKHAHARSITIRFTRSESGEVLEVADDGTGMADDAGAKPMSNGILGMRERARELHGECIIISVPGNGTTVTVTLPLKSPAPA